jgi:hypothetical protein
MVGFYKVSFDIVHIVSAQGCGQDWNKPIKFLAGMEILVLLK